MQNTQKGTLKTKLIILVLELYNLFAKHVLVQTVSGPTNIVTQNITTDNITTATTSKHCIDLVATDQPNIIIKNEVAPSLHSNCSHQINLVKLDLKSSPPPPYKRKVFHYARANGPSFRESLFNFDWADQLELLSNYPSDQVELLDSTILNVTNNFIPNNEKPLLRVILHGSQKPQKHFTTNTTENFRVMLKEALDLRKKKESISCATNTPIWSQKKKKITLVNLVLTPLIQEQLAKILDLP